MSKKLRALGTLAVLMMAASCGGNKNSSGDGNGNGLSANGAPSTSRGCGTSRSAPSSVDSWSSFKQHVYNCDFDYVVNNVSGYNSSNNNNYFGGFQQIMPMVAEYSFAATSCDSYSGCYPVGSFSVSVDLDQNTGRIRSIVDPRKSVNSESAAHSYIKNLVVGSISNTQKVGPKAYQFDKGDKTYVIDLEWPMVANPVMEQPRRDNSNRNNNYSNSGQGFWITGETQF